VLQLLRGPLPRSRQCFFNSASFIQRTSSFVCRFARTAGLSPGGLFLVSMGRLLTYTVFFFPHHWIPFRAATAAFVPFALGCSISPAGASLTGLPWTYLPAEPLPFPGVPRGTVSGLFPTEDLAGFSSDLFAVGPVVRQGCFFFPPAFQVSSFSRGRRTRCRPSYAAFFPFFFGCGYLSRDYCNRPGGRFFGISFIFFLCLFRGACEDLIWLF